VLQQRNTVSHHVTCERLGNVHSPQAHARLLLRENAARREAHAEKLARLRGLDWLAKAKDDLSAGDGRQVDERKGRVAADEQRAARVETAKVGTRLHVRADEANGEARIALALRAQLLNCPGHGLLAANHADDAIVGAHDAHRRSIGGFVRKGRDNEREAQLALLQQRVHTHRLVLVIHNQPRPANVHRAHGRRVLWRE